MINPTKFASTLICTVALTMIGVAIAYAQAPSITGTKEGFVTTTDGVRIHYIEAGTRAGQGPALLFVPGWTMPAWIWEKQLQHFSKTRYTVAMDPRAQGQSTQSTEGLYPAARARDIKTVVDQLKLAPVVLIGWSLAVTELAAYVDQFGTSTLAGLVLVDGQAGIDITPDLAKQALTSFNKRAQGDRHKSTEAFVRSMYKTPQTEEYLKRVIDASLITPTNSASVLGLTGFVTDNRPALAKIDKPTLIIYVAGGWIARGSSSMIASKAMQKQIKGSRLEMMKDAGHALFVDQAARFNSLLEDFLSPLAR